MTWPTFTPAAATVGYERLRAAVGFCGMVPAGGSFRMSWQMERAFRLELLIVVPASAPLELTLVSANRIEAEASGSTFVVDTATPAGARMMDQDIRAMAAALVNAPRAARRTPMLAADDCNPVGRLMMATLARRAFNATPGRCPRFEVPIAPGADLELRAASVDGIGRELVALALGVAL